MVETAISKKRYVDTLSTEINGKKYILFEINIPAKNANSFNRKIKSYDGFFQSIITSDSFWFGTMLKIKYLIPEEQLVKSH